MAIGKTAAGMILAGWIAVSAAEFPMRHEHLRKGCNGVMTVDDDGVRFAGPKGHAWTWKYQDIEQLRLEPARIRILTYKDNKWRLGADRAFEFTGTPPYETLLQIWRDLMDQRFVAALPPLTSVEGVFSIPVKHLKRLSGSEGSLVFDDDSIAYSASGSGESRIWRYSDIDRISSSGPFQLTITTFERDRSDYGERKDFNFQLKQPITEARYNEIWLQIERKNGRIQ
ncbi:MAG TPA: hypothetical protein VKT49_19280 [Bryobacteraceae bacterium]|nr:hypothetical protein [Bryobacteraceae bacterium]